MQNNPNPMKPTTQAKCTTSPKWLALINDALVSAPRQIVTAQLLRDQASIPADHALVRDHGSQHDVRIEDSDTLDLAEGNVFFTLPRCDYRPKTTCLAPAKLAWFVNDAAEITLKAEQTGQTIRTLFDLPTNAPLVRDYESPQDEEVPADEATHFADGPVFYSRAGQQPHEVTIIVNGREVNVTGPTISYAQVVALAFPQVDADTICTVTYKRGHPSKPEGGMVNGDIVKLNCGMIFNVTPTRKS